VGDLVVVTGLAQRLLDAGEAAAQVTDDEVVMAVGLRACRPLPSKALSRATVPSEIAVRMSPRVACASCGSAAGTGSSGGSIIGVDTSPAIQVADRP